MSANFNNQPYDDQNNEYNQFGSIYIDGSNNISLSGTKYYNSLFPDLMASFVVDKGDSILGGNVIIAGDTKITGNLNVGSDLSLNKRLFVNGDVSLNSSLYIKKSILLDAKTPKDGFMFQNDVFFENKVYIKGIEMEQ